jgi:hypothetical protein
LHTNGRFARCSLISIIRLCPSSFSFRLCEKFAHPQIHKHMHFSITVAIFRGTRANETFSNWLLVVTMSWEITNYGIPEFGRLGSTDATIHTSTHAHVPLLPDADSPRAHHAYEDDILFVIPKCKIQSALSLPQRNCGPYSSP